jgi:PAS domain S-box-containing protein
MLNRDAAGDSPGTFPGVDLQAAVFDSCGAAIYVKDLDGRFLLVNKHVEQLFHVPKKQIEGKSDFEIFPKKVAEQLREHDRHVLEAGVSMDCEESVELADGPHVYVSIKFPIRNSLGTIVALGGISSDITERVANLASTNEMLRAETAERQRTELELKEREQHYRALIESTSDFVTILDAEGVVSYVSPSIEQVLGYTPAERHGMSTLQHIHPEDLPAVRKTLSEGIPIPDATATVEARFRHKDGSWRVMESIGRNLLHVPAIRGIVITSRDITEHKRVEAALRKSEAALIQSQGQLQRFTAGLLTAQEVERRRISRELHDDLNQRLAMLAVEVESLERDLPVSHGDVVDRLRTLRNRIGGLSDDVRRTAYQLHPSTLEHLGLVAALKACCSDLSAQDSIRAHFTHRHVPASLQPEVALCLYRVTQESLRNVAKHSGQREATVALTGSKTEIHLSIADKGVGFETAAARSRGGLGIVSMEERVRLNGGAVSIRSRPGAGTRIDVRIPISEENYDSPSSGDGG